ncbi:unnamed protein product [Calypogeia fissa]
MGQLYDASSEQLGFVQEVVNTASTEYKTYENLFFGKLKGVLLQYLLAMLVVGWTVGIVLLACFPRFLLWPLPSSTLNIGKRARRVLLLVAHPDDECMFFGPTLLSLRMQPTIFDLRVLCISSGNADGLGERRKLEMISSCAVLKVLPEHVEVLDHPALQDGHRQEWNQQLLVEIIHQKVKSQEIDIVITFDGYGVSGHPNHSALSRALRAYILRASKHPQSYADLPPVEGWELVSLNIARKYSGVLEICFSTLGWLMSGNKSKIHCFLTPNPLTSVAAMKQHESQWVWFRRLFVVFAAYTYINVLKKIESQQRIVTKTREVGGWTD